MEDHTPIKETLWWCLIYDICCNLKENILGFLYLCKGSILGKFQCQLLLWQLSMVCPVFSLAIVEILFVEVFFKIMRFSFNFLWDMLGTIFICLYVLGFPIFWSICLWRVLCFLVVFQRLTVGCWVVDILLFLKLFLQVSLLVHFLQYLDGLSSILSSHFVILDLCPWGSLELLLQWHYDSFLSSEKFQLVLLTDS